MISLDAITVSYGGFTLLDNVSLHIGDRERIGLVGKNGAGKSTMLKLIMELQSPTSGKITRTSGQRIGYLPQIMEHHRGRTVIEEVMTVYDELDRLNRRLDEITLELADRTDYESEAYHRLIVELNEVNDALVIAQGESPEESVERTLMGLGFKKPEFDRKTETFSQGWNMRIELAKILLRRPDVLLLDEPTNHLDIESIQWLEDYLKGSYSGSLVLISHDRRFLDNCTTRTVEVMLGHLYDYKVPYSQYVELRKERIAQQKAAYANQQRMIEKTEEFIEKFRYKPTMWSCSPPQASIHPLIAGPQGSAWLMRFLHCVDVPLHPVARGRRLIVTGARQVCLLLPEPLSGHPICKEPSWSQGRAVASWSGSLRAGGP